MPRNRRQSSPRKYPTTPEEIAALDLADLAHGFCDAVDRNDPVSDLYIAELMFRYNNNYDKTQGGEVVSSLENAMTLRGRVLPLIIPQQTSQEVRSLAVAISDGRAMSHWEEVLGEVAMRHAVPGEPFQVKFAPGASFLSWGSTSIGKEMLRAQLNGCDLDTVLLLYEVLGASVLQLARGVSGQVTVALDELILALGWDKAARRSSEDRNRLRLRIWQWLLVFDSLEVVGKRPGHYRDPGTGRLLDLQSHDALLRIVGQRIHGSVTTINGQLIPLEVTIAPGSWLERHRGNRQILSDFGNVRALARLAPGKRGGHMGALHWDDAFATLARTGVAHRAPARRSGKERGHQKQKGREVSARSPGDVFGFSVRVHGRQLLPLHAARASHHLVPRPTGCGEDLGRPRPGARARLLGSSHRFAPQPTLRVML